MDVRRQELPSLATYTLRTLLLFACWYYPSKNSTSMSALSRLSTYAFHFLQTTKVDLRP